MPVLRRRRSRRGGDLRWLLIIAGFFAYLLLLTWERVEVKERNGRLQCLERLLEEKRTDEALRIVQLERETDFLAVRQVVDDLEMRAAGVDQRILLAAAGRPVRQEAPDRSLQVASRWLHRTLHGGIAQAQPSASGGGHAEGSR